MFNVIKKMFNKEIRRNEALIKVLNIDTRLRISYKEWGDRVDITTLKFLDAYLEANVIVAQRLEENEYYYLTQSGVFKSNCYEKMLLGLELKHIPENVSFKDLLEKQLREIESISKYTDQLPRNRVVTQFPKIGWIEEEMWLPVRYFVNLRGRREQIPQFINNIEELVKGVYGTKDINIEDVDIVDDIPHTPFGKSIGKPNAFFIEEKYGLVLYFCALGHIDHHHFVLQTKEGRILAEIEVDGNTERSVHTVDEMLDLFLPEEIPHESWKEYLALNQLGKGMLPVLE